MNGVKLKLNPDKIEFIIFVHNNTRDPHIPKLPITFLQNSINNGRDSENLAVTFDSENTFI